MGIDYEIIDAKPLLPKWVTVFLSLPNGKMIKITSDDKVKIERQRQSIRRILYRNEIRVVTRVIQEGNNYILYIWKLSKE